MRCDQAQDHLRVSEMEKKPVNGVQPFDGKRAYMTSVQRIQGQPEKTQADGLLQTCMIARTTTPRAPIAHEMNK